VAAGHCAEHYFIVPSFEALIDRAFGQAQVATH